MGSLRYGLVLLGFTAVLGCSASEDGFGGGGGSSSSSGSTSGGGGSQGTGGTGGGSFTTSSGSGSGGGAPVDAEVFAHSAGTLYRLDPVTKTVTTVGNFSNCGGGQVIDIAIDKDGVMFGTTFGGLNRIDKATAACTPIAADSYPNSLSFVPEGTVDPNEEALVGFVGGTYMRIDKVTGAMTQIGSLGAGYSSSGDVVSVIGGGTYLTVKGNACDDCIVQVNPTTGALVGVIGSLNHTDVFGLAFWGGSAYGFDNSGQLFEVNLSDGSATNISMPNPPPGLSFWGAGSTTAAPLMPPE